MLDFPRWKVWLVTLASCVGILLAVPSLLPGPVATLAGLAAERPDQPRPRHRRRQPLLLEAELADAAKQRLQAKEERSRPSCAAASRAIADRRRLDRGRQAAASWSAIRPSSTPRSSGCGR